MLSAWGEPLIKAFVQEAVDHSLRLGKALTNLATEGDKYINITFKNDELDSKDTNLGTQ
jgi:hypothetical protein